ncbi:acylneuraminate cytidylyltransferase family protein [Vibrio comitans]|uniref:N-acylneuraminate cytidylyltransferase n=1 Tax=Vibrio comitans NBRC 102076 TaxID=1219078 RepID=A0A4Y3IRZ4_9VIBR|nr:acylneuraminate cytidylyltransferase family protein [Vibrio comitans]GEA61977.1 hypothetical protein VCO01S_31700 [Vibrio comitans NBRC 102076]
MNSEKKQYKNVALITARGGSKGLIRKNVKILNGMPLIGWTIKAAQECTEIDRIFVSTEDQEIAMLSSELGAEIIDRPPELSEDHSTSQEVVKHAIGWLEEHQIEYSNIVLLQPTSPMRTGKHITEAIGIMETKNAEFVISVFEPKYSPTKSYVEKPDGSITGILHSDAPYMRRQDLPRSFQPNGAIYIFSASQFKVFDHFPKTGVFPFLMSEYDSIDIDSIDDFKVVEQRLKDIRDD